MAPSWKRDYVRYKDYFLNIVSSYNAKPNLKIYLELILSLSTIAIFSFFAIRPTILTIVELSKELKAKEETSALLQKKIADLQIAGATLQRESQNTIYVDQAVPEKANPEVFIKQVETLATQNSLTILGFASSDVPLVGRPEINKKAAGLKKLANNANELPFTFSASGSYQNIFNFVTQIENLRRPIKFDSFVVSSNTTDTGKVIVLTIAGRVPFLIDNTAVTKTTK